MKLLVTSLIQLFVVTSLIQNAYAGVSICSDRTYSRGGPIEGCLYYESGKNLTDEQYVSVKNLVLTIDPKYIKIEDGLPLEMTEEEKAVVDSLDQEEQEQQELLRIERGEVSGQEILKAIPAILKDSQNYKELTEETIIQKIKEQKGL